MCEKLPPEYPFVHIYPQQKARQAVIIKGNTEGLYVLLNALITAIARLDNVGVAEVYDQDAEPFDVVINLVKTHEQLSPIPYQMNFDGDAKTN